MERDSTVGTIVVAVAVCIVCSVLVSGSAVLLNDWQEANKLLYKKTNVLLAAGLVEKGTSPSADDVDKMFKEQVTTLLVELGETPTIVDPEQVDYNAYDPREAANNQDDSVEIGNEKPAPGLKRRANKQFVYRIHAVNKPEEVEQFVLPISGKGLWSTLYGFISLDADGVTVRGITFYEHAETPGLGGEVENVIWQKKWEDKIAYKDGVPVIEVLKGSAPPDAESQIDGLSGATITTQGVSNFVQYWLGDRGFGPFIKQQVAEAAKTTSADTVSSISN